MKMQIKCPNCQYTGPGEKKGSFWVELFLWLIFIVVGFAVSIVFLLIPLIYTVWRLFNLGIICPNCGYKYIVKLGPTI